METKIGIFPWPVTDTTWQISETDNYNDDRRMLFFSG
jgi:hypothetical protein